MLGHKHDSPFTELAGLTGPPPLPAPQCLRAAICPALSIGRPQLSHNVSVPDNLSPASLAFWKAFLSGGERLEFPPG